MSILDIVMACLGIALASLEPAVHTLLALIAVRSRRPHRRADARAMLYLLQRRDDKPEHR